MTVGTTNLTHSEDVKPSNILVNYGEDQGVMRFSDVQLGDFGDSYPQDSRWAKSGTQVGAPIWSSPEVLMETPWTTATDIWSFGTLVRSLSFLSQAYAEGGHLIGSVCS